MSESYTSTSETLIAETHNSVIETFNKLCGPPVAGESDISGCPRRDKIVGLISFVGDLTSTLAIILPHDSAETLIEKFAGVEIPFLDSEMADAVGELINILAGVLSGNLEKRGLRTYMSLPTVARGEVFDLMVPHKLVSERLCFSAGPSDFWIDVTAMRSTVGDQRRN